MDVALVLRRDLICDFSFWCFLRFCFYLFTDLRYMYSDLSKTRSQARIHGPVFKLQLHAIILLLCYFYCALVCVPFLSLLCFAFSFIFEFFTLAFRAFASSFYFSVFVLRQNWAGICGGREVARVHI